jgi:hypothetical protein
MRRNYAVAGAIAMKAQTSANSSEGEAVRVNVKVIFRISPALTASAEGVADFTHWVIPVPAANVEAGEPPVAALVITASVALREVLASVASSFVATN